MEGYIGEIRAFAYDRVPEGWLPCEGQDLAIAQNQALYSLIGNKFGNANSTTFKLPDLRGRAILGVGMLYNTTNYYNQGFSAGSEDVTLNANQIPAHIHGVKVMASNGDTTIPTNYLAVPDVKATTLENINLYSEGCTQSQPLNGQTISSTGGQAHTNMQPFLAIKYCIAIIGYYPPRP